MNHYSDKTVGAVHYKPPIDRAAQMGQHANILDYDTERLTHDWQ